MRPAATWEVLWQRLPPLPPLRHGRQDLEEERDKTLTQLVCPRSRTWIRSCGSCQGDTRLRTWAAFTSCTR